MSEDLVELVSNELEFCAHGEVSTRVQRQSGMVMLTEKKTGDRVIPANSVKGFYIDVCAAPARIYVSWQNPGDNMKKQMIGTVHDLMQASAWVHRVNNLYRT